MRIDIRKEMAACVRKIGGVVLGDVLRSPEFANADHWFPDCEVIAELKCLTENLASKHEFNDRVSKMHDEWVRQGLLPRPIRSKITLSLRDIPISCAREFLDAVKRRLEVNVLKKANAQIKGLKNQLEALRCRLEQGKSLPFAQPDRSPAALPRRPLAAG